MRLRPGALLKAVSVVALLLVSWGGSSSMALPPSGQGRLVFTAGLGAGRGFSGDPVANAIFSARTDGTDVRRLGTGDVSYFGNPVWSPDGSLIAFDYSGVGVAVMRSDGSRVRHLCSRTCLYGAWSPDGSRIAYALRTASGDCTPCGIGVMRAAGDDKRTILRLPYEAFSLDWSPDGRLIAFQVAFGDRAGTYLVHPDGTGLRKLKSSGLWTSPKWSPAGTQLLIVRRGSNSDGIYMVDLRTNVKTRIVRSPDVTAATWSPDGRQVAYGDLHGRIFVRDLKTGHARQLTLHPSPCKSVALGKSGGKVPSCSPWLILDVDWTSRP